jgi:hypothetical protein
MLRKKNEKKKSMGIISKMGVVIERQNMEVNVTQKRLLMLYEF